MIRKLLNIENFPRKEYDPKKRFNEEEKGRIIGEGTVGNLAPVYVNTSIHTYIRVELIIN